MGLVEQYRACGEGVDRRRRVVLVAVAAEVVRPQAVHEDDAEVRLCGRGGRGAAEDNQGENWRDIRWTAETIRATSAAKNVG